MIGKYYRTPQYLPRSLNFSSHNSSEVQIRAKRSQQLQKRFRQRRLYGDHFNYHQVGLNKQKKYMLQEQKNTQIQRANRILLEKIKKIGQRSVQLNLRRRAFTQQVQEQEHIPNRKTNNNNFCRRKQSPLRSTNHQLTKSKFSDLNSSRRNHQYQKKELFKGVKQIDGTQLSITIYIEQDMYIIYSQNGNMQHKIQMNLQSYKILLQESLNGDHNNIFNVLTFNGTLLELVGTKKQNISIVQQQQLTLPLVQKTKTVKHRFQTDLKMNFVKLFSESDLLQLQLSSTLKDFHQILHKKGINTNAVSSLLTELYRFMTIQGFSLEQKQKIVNLGIQLLKSIPQSSTKEVFYQTIVKALGMLSERDESLKLSFTPGELTQLKEFFLSKILPSFELYEIVLDDHPHFTLEAKSSELITVISEKSLQSGTSVDVEGIAVLSQFLGIRGPKEDKKDMKKK